MYTDVSRSDFIGISEGLEVWDCFPAGEMSRFGSLGDVGDMPPGKHQTHS